MFPGENLNVILFQDHTVGSSREITLNLKFIGVVGLPHTHDRDCFGGMYLFIFLLYFFCIVHKSVVLFSFG